jgi:lysine 6-dehydrogenase
VNILVIGAGMMGRAIAFDLANYSNFEEITISDKDKKNLKSAKKFLKNKPVSFDILDIEKRDYVKSIFQKNDIVISAIPYHFNYILTKIAIDTKTHFLDLGGNNNIVEKQRSLFKKAEENKVLIIPDCGLAPGLTSIIARDAVDSFDSIEYVKIRVGGLPQKPIPPFNYQIVFSPNGLINEYVEDAIVLDHGEIVTKKSMTELEEIRFPKPFNKLEAFITSGGCSTLPNTYKDKIDYLDYKTIRYPGHCEKMKTFLDLGLGSEKEILIGNQKIIPRNILINLLLSNIPKKGKDVVLIKVFSKGIKENKNVKLDYTMIDYYDDKNHITAMMRTTGFPVSIIAQMIENGKISEYGVFSGEEIAPTKLFFRELKKRNIVINKELREI